MSYPSSLDLVLGSEQASVDTFIRFSTGKSENSNNDNNNNDNNNNDDNNASLSSVRTEPFFMRYGTGQGGEEKVRVVACFSDPVGISLDDLVGGSLSIILEEGAFVTVINQTEPDLRLLADIDGTDEDENFQFPKELTYYNDNKTISVKVNIYDEDGQTISDPITINETEECNADIIKVTE